MYRHQKPAAVPQEPRWHRARGYEPDVARVLAAQMGRELQWAIMPWSQMPRCAAARGGRGSMWSRNHRLPRGTSRLHQAYGVFHEGVLVRSGSGITSPADLVGRKVAAIADSANMMALLLSFEGAIPVPFGGDSDDVFAEMLGALDAGEVDAVVDDDVVFVPLDDDPHYEQAFTVKTGNRWGIGVAKDRPELLAEIDSALAAVIANGQLAQVWHTWLPSLEFPLGDNHP